MMYREIPLPEQIRLVYDADHTESSVSILREILCVILLLIFLGMGALLSYGERKTMVSRNLGTSWLL